MKKIDLILFLDDNKATNYYHKVIIGEAKVCNKCRFFQSPRETISYFEELATKEGAKIPDVFFLDINMPEISGWEFLEAFQEIPLAKRPRIIMLSTSLNPDDTQKTSENPLVSGMVAKPLTEAFLEELCKNLAE